jgi:hypothetical protein
MSSTLNDVVPWGKSFDEYVAMFVLSDADLQRQILGCGDGPASFNTLLSKQGEKFYPWTRCRGSGLLHYPSAKALRAPDPALSMARSRFNYGFALDTLTLGPLRLLQ